MTANECVCCARLTPDGYACMACGVEKPQRHLSEIGDLLGVCEDVAYGQTARTQTGGGGGGGEPRLELNLAAKARLDAVGNALTSWTRHISEERGLREPKAGTYSVYAMSDDPIEFAAQWLGEHCEWMRHRAEVDEFVRDVANCAALMRSVAERRRNPGRYAGPCISEAENGICGEDVIARPGADFGKCRKCGAEYDVEEQQAWMRGEIEGHLARPVEIAGVLLRLGFTIGYSTIAAYAAKGKIAAKGADAKGNPLYRIGDVMDARMRTEKPRRSVERSRGAANPAGG